MLSFTTTLLWFFLPLCYKRWVALHCLLNYGKGNPKQWSRPFYEQSLLLYLDLLKLLTEAEGQEHEEMLLYKHCICKSWNAPKASPHYSRVSCKSKNFSVQSWGWNFFWTGSSIHLPLCSFTVGGGAQTQTLELHSPQLSFPPNVRLQTAAGRQAMQTQGDKHTHSWAESMCDVLKRSRWAGTEWPLCFHDGKKPETYKRFAYLDEPVRRGKARGPPWPWKSS